MMENEAERESRLVSVTQDLLGSLEALVERGTDSPVHMQAERAIERAKAELTQWGAAARATSSTS